MSIQTKQDFKYATLYQPEDGSFCTDGSQDGLVMDPETARRFEENDDCAVTVCCITYNHELTIRKALDSFLMQKTNFKFKVFVGEDHGPDGTADIVREYAEKYPEIIIPFLREENMGAQNNLIDLCNHATSPYIAFCEGDDYWVDEYKLQKQYDYMQAHENIRVCFTRTEIEAPEDWHLRSYYRADRHGRMIMPETLPGYKMPKRNLKAPDLISVIPIHTSTHFYRWNYGLKLPEWFYKGVEGAFPLLMMQMGLGEAGFLPDLTSVYRRTDVGVLMNTSNTEHFLKTRMDYIRFLSNLREYFIENYDGYCRVQFENRIKAEGYNYLSNAVKCEDYEAIQRFFVDYPESSCIALGAYLSFYADSRALTRTCGWDGYQLLARHRVYRQILRPVVWGLKIVHKCKTFIKKLLQGAKKVLKDFFSWICYWRYSLTPKKKNLWAITGFRGRAYMDNAKYFYEYILAHYPEIDIRWLTNDDDVYAMLKEEGKPVCKFGTKEGRKVLSHAYIAITDHNIMSDYTPLDGFNNKTKVVQLWHGVGFKAMGDGKNVKLVRERGVRYSDDILVKPGDNPFKKLWKKVKYFFCAHRRELFEKYFLFVCPGQERIDMIAKIWNISDESIFMAGHPRDILLHQMKPDLAHPKVLYAPTFRYNPVKELEMVDQCIKAFDAIEEMMEKVNGQFVIRLHPHTWRNYHTKLLHIMTKYQHISLDQEKDVYTSLGEYSVIISDYSSISLDFAMLDRPTVYHCADYKWFVQNEAGFNLDFPNVIPGPMTSSWEETLERVKEYCENPQKDSDLRQEKIKYFFDQSVNGPDNSARIVDEIKRRIQL